MAQRNRTRKAIVDATIRLMADGRTPSVADVVEAAQVSRRTVYLYFPKFEQLLLDATLGALSAAPIDAVMDATASNDAAANVEQLIRAMCRNGDATLHLGRELIRLTIDAEDPPAGAPRRGYRRVAWIEQALEGARSKLPRAEFERLVSALSVLTGWEPLIVLKDVRGLDHRGAEEVLAFAARAVVEAALRDKIPRRGAPNG